MDTERMAAHTQTAKVTAVGVLTIVFVAVRGHLMVSPFAYSETSTDLRVS